MGVWKSEEPSLILYIDPIYRSLVLPFNYLGIYTVDGEEVKVFLKFDNRHRNTPALIIEATEKLVDRDSMVRSRHENVLFNTANLRTIDDQIHFNGWTRDANGDNIEVEMIFNRLEDYDPIDPEEWFPSPRGVWESEEPNIVLYIDPAYRSATETRHLRFLGIYMLDSEEIKITASFGPLMHWLRITTAPVVDENNRQVFNGAERMLGDLKIIEDQLHFELDPEYQELTGLTTIIFNRATDYSSIVPADWGH